MTPTSNGRRNVRRSPVLRPFFWGWVLLGFLGYLIQFREEAMMVAKMLFGAL
ncbi:MAG: hypothetical protein HOM58_09150 [Rhodospirillaceae bacterium]|jgi:hypothetical protein|nr:hypothetical protein [Rhodospirillaceae bacterium]MBT5455021.1 hypothetical protein [Rhodospirillaceae bacterium]